MINIAGIEYSSIVDGPGIRVAIFLQGCDHHCPGCHNPETHTFGIGKKFTIEELIKDIESNSISNKLTLSGGDPIYQYKECIPLVRYFKSKNYNILVYTGFTIHDIINRCSNDESFYTYMSYIDTIITEPYIEECRSTNISFRGSTNQKVYECINTIDYDIRFVDISNKWDNIDK